MNHALNEDRIKEQDQLTKENSQESDLKKKKKEKKCSFYYHSNDRKRNCILSISFCSSLLTLLLKAYLQILIFNYYPNKFIIVVTKCM